MRLAFLLSFLLALSSVCALDQPDSSPAPEETDPDIALAFRLERGFQKLAKRIAPCVVSLKVSAAQTKNWSEEMRRISEHYSADRKYEGSGVVVDPSGWIITNEHVVRDADSIVVTFADGRSFPAEVTGLDPRSDLAMIKLKGDDIPKDLPCAQLADSDKVQVGQYAMAIGNPFGLANSVTLGVISARGRNRYGVNNGSDVFYGNLIQTDTPINPGNSGGPLFDLSGRVIGITTMIYSPSGVSQACGFAIPSNHLKPRLEPLKVGRDIEYGWLGVELDELGGQKRAFKVPENKGVLVRSVIANTPADRAGMKHGMVILNVDGTRVGTREELIGTINSIPIGRLITVKVIDTQGTESDYSVRISKRYSEMAQLRRYAPAVDLENLPFDPSELEDDFTSTKIDKKDPKGLNAPFTWRGMQFKELNAPDGKKKGGRLEIVRVKKGSPADRAGLYEGAVIAELKHAGNPAIQPLTTVDDLKKLAAQVTGPASLYVPLDGYVTVDEK